MKFTDALNDKNSPEFKKLANELGTGLKEMLNKSELSEQATFNVTIDSFRPGSVVCNFKVNYILKEAYLALPFAIKPSNVTDTMNKNFKFKKGVLFQKFLIVGGSFKSAAPIDHCAAKGCSHKCNYDYDIEDYVCTCPPSLTLNTDQKTCVDPANVDETQTEATDDETSSQPEITISVLPTDCTWSPWSEWSECLCGVNTTRRSRKVQIEAKNGGVCSGEYEEAKACDTVACNDSDVFIEIPENTEQVSTTEASDQTDFERNAENSDQTTQSPVEDDSVTEQGTGVDATTEKHDEYPEETIDEQSEDKSTDETSTDIIEQATDASNEETASEYPTEEASTGEPDIVLPASTMDPQESELSTESVEEAITESSEEVVTVATAVAVDEATTTSSVADETINEQPVDTEPQAGETDDNA